MSEDVLVVYGLGSCVAVCLYDPVAQVGGMLHALLPSAPGDNGANGTPTKFVDRGLPILFEKMMALGAQQNRLLVYLCGGAQILSAPGFSNNLNIGQRNIQTAEALLQEAGFRIRAKDIGGNAGRTVKLNIRDGQVTVKTLGKGEQILA